MVRDGLPFVLMAAEDDHGHAFREPDDRARVILEPRGFSDASRKRWLAVCVRKGEWGESREAKGEIPPCMACYTVSIKNCDLGVRNNCANGVLEQIVGRESSFLAGASSGLKRMPEAGSYREEPAATRDWYDTERDGPDAYDIADEVLP